MRYADTLVLGLFLGAVFGVTFGFNAALSKVHEGGIEEACSVPLGKVITSCQEENK